MGLPIGTVIAFYGTLMEAQNQQPNGWWICDGQHTVNDPASPWNGKPTPDLRKTFVRGADNNLVGTKGGSATYTIPDQTIQSHTTGFGLPQIYCDPFTHMQGAHTWDTDDSIYSEGTYKGPTVPTVPPFLDLIYLIKIK
jgi:hypothetical protein